MTMAELQLFPFSVVAPIEMESIRIYGSPSVPQGVVVRGRLETTHEPFLSIVFERPTFWNELVDATKEDRERTQLERFLRDYRLAVGKPLATDYRRGDDPPDFVLSREDGSATGIECTQLVYGDRIHAWRSMDSLRDGLLSMPRKRFDHLRDRTVYVSTSAPSGLPPAGKRGNELLAAALEKFQPSSANFATVPQSLAGTDVVQHVDEFFLTAAPLDRSEDRPFVQRMGWDLALSVQTDVLASEAWATLTERVHEKDVSGSDAILVSCGAPVVNGLSFPSDELAAEAIEASAVNNGIAATTYLKTIYVHVWTAERLMILTPGQGGADVLTPR